MTYSSATINNANSGSALLAALDAVITTVTGLSRVSTAVVSGTMTWNVYKSAGANNAIGVDWYFALGYLTATPTSLKIAIFENWNVGSSLALYYPPSTSSVVPDSQFRNPAGAVALPSSGTGFGYFETQTLTTMHQYFASITVDRIVVGILTSATTSFGFYVGEYDAFNPLTIDPCPITVGTTIGTGTTGAAPTATPTSTLFLCTREPGTTATNGANFGAGASPQLGSNWTQNDNSVVDAYKLVGYMSRVLLRGRQASAYRGLLKDIYSGPTQTNNGDEMTWTLGGTTYTGVRIGFYSGLAWYVLKV